MRTLIATIAGCMLLAVTTTNERQWLTGTWVSAGIRHSNWTTGAAGRSTAITTGSSTTVRSPEVGVYVIESPEMRLEIEDLSPIASSRIETEFKVGGAVTFSIDKNTVYIRLADGPTERLRITKKTVKKK